MVRAQIPSPAVHTVTCLSFPETNMTTQIAGSWYEKDTLFENETAASKGSFGIGIRDMDTGSNVIELVSSQQHRRRSI